MPEEREDPAPEPTPEQRTLNAWEDQAKDAISRHRGDGYAEHLMRCVAFARVILSQRDECMEMLKEVMPDKKKK